MTEEIKLLEHKLSRRERQIMDAVFSLGEASVSEIVDAIPNPPTTGAVRSAMILLKKKGLLTSRYDGPRKVYAPAKALSSAGKKALRHVLQTYFEGSVSLAVSALLDSTPQKLSNQEKTQIIELIKKAKKEGK
ncbi:MAG: BlaI/MecI/CopY family transcriptional regulator [Candidatus Aminicenantes bacterium]|nr:MAG: BlaI/MecI/CopY family transcriptional regulator [Candidatus Aminicenantes bacterium]